MSKRGIDFLEKWMAEHLPNAFTDDPAAITDLADQAIKAAEKKASAWKRSAKKSAACSTSSSMRCRIVPAARADDRAEVEKVLDRYRGSGDARHRCSGAVAVLCGSLTSLKSNGRESGPTAEH